MSGVVPEFVLFVWSRPAVGAGSRVHSNTTALPVPHAFVYCMQPCMAPMMAPAAHACSLEVKSYLLKAYRGSTDIDTLPVPNFGLFFLNRWFSVRHQLNSTTSPTTLYEPKYKTVLLCMSPSTQKPSVLLNLLNPI